MSGAAPLLDVRDLHVSFPVPRGVAATLRRTPRRAARAVDGVSFQLAAGEIVALVGESGCGKSTTAQAILRLVEADAGTVWLAGEDVTRAPAGELRRLRRRMQLIYQDPYQSLNPRLRVRDAVAEPLQVQGIRDDRAGRVARALETAGLTPPDTYLERRPHELSGGQRQRVAIAASLVLEPELLVADEPVSMLDVSIRAGVLRVLDGLRGRGIGVLMISHDLSTAAHLADRIAVMYLGRIVEEGPADEIVKNPRHPYTAALISAVPDPDPRRGTAEEILVGETPDATRIPSGCRFHPRCPVRVEVCPRLDPPLEQARDAAAGHRAACVHAYPEEGGGAGARAQALDAGARR
jgi:oligopeptide/dipeptide ABC transporter ATP-binding protein